MYLNEEDAFWALSALMSSPKYAMHGAIYLNTEAVGHLPVGGERLLVAFAYCILKLHRRQITRLDMDQILDYLQKKKNFGYEDDYVIESLEKAMEELKKAKLDHPGAPPDNELPQQPFGMFIEPSVEKESGIRRGFTEEERLITEKLMKRTETIGINGSHLSVDRGSRYSLECSIDEVSSLGGVGGSRASLANTSLTSAADLSTLSSVTLARRGDMDAASIQSGRSLISPDTRSVQSVRSPRSPTEKFRHSNNHSPSQSLPTQTNGDVHSDASPSTPRPSCLSVSQTTLQDGEALQSEPATPKATETPDTGTQNQQHQNLKPQELLHLQEKTPNTLLRAPTIPIGSPFASTGTKLSPPREGCLRTKYLLAKFCRLPRSSLPKLLVISSGRFVRSLHHTSGDELHTGHLSTDETFLSPISPSLPKLQTARSRPITLDSPEYSEGLL
ncbi:putative USP6 N-terminal-like protein isoform X2 [Penaeus vannamei]|uniref:Putative USP6 N-terminal-like protein isoform X2 n=1 Tax=Penaeus vannamei TaxID=6689 RepID=A0A423TBN7_PENVA|nr:putative USP6 N-terminal-like protein isoform X2 [Penaeus vannamei]